MKKLFLTLILLTGCGVSKPMACYNLEMCEVTLHGSSDHWYSNPTFNVYCIYGYDSAGKKNGDVKRFMSRDALSAWSILNQEAKPCDGK